MSRKRHQKPRHSDEADDRPAPRDPERAAREDAEVGQEAAPDAPPPEAEAADGQAPPDTLEAGLAESQREVQDLKDRLQRLAADFSNYQKRMQRRLEEEKREAVREFLRDLLPVIDNFERALAAADEGGDPASFHQGVRLVHDQLIEALARHGVEPIDAAGRRFDPEHHEAVAHVPSEEHPSGHVIDEVQRGYRHGDRTLRPSRVAVSRGPAEAEAGESEAEEAGRDREDAEHES
jgi:molecular chaperone GrpE